jgi:hypothetical protein
MMSCWADGAPSPLARNWRTFSCNSDESDRCRSGALNASASSACTHMAVLAVIDFFTVEVLTSHGLAAYYLLFSLHLETRRVTLAGITQHPTEEWMVQMARNAGDVIDGRAARPLCFTRSRHPVL